MPGFHPLLGLLAVAVCISYADGAPISTVVKDDITAHKLRNQNLHISPLTPKEDGPLPSGLYSRKNKISNAVDSQHRNFIRERKYEHSNEVAAFSKINYLKSKGKDADLTEAKASIGEDAVGGGRALRKEEPSEYFQENSRNSAKRVEEKSRLAIGSVFARSDLKGGEDGESSTPQSMTTTETGDDTHTEREDDCETEEPSTSESTEPTTSPYTRQTKRKWDRTTTTTQRAKRTSDPYRSSGSFPESDSEGVNFSDSVSMESSGRSTEIWD